MEHRVVITGIGAYSCLGENITKVLHSLQHGKSGIVYDEQRQELGYRSCLTGFVKEPDLKPFLSRRERLGMHQPAMYAYMSTREALLGSGIDIDFLSKHETGIIFGNDSTAGAIVKTTDRARERKDTTLIGSGDIFQNMNCTVNMNLSTIFKLKGINFTISAACASGSHAIGMAYLLIKQGLQERIVCGGAQEINAFAMASFDGLGTFSVREHEPQRASRPFDKNRDGLVPSGGAATLILESWEVATKRNAPIFGELIGYGFSSNGEHISNPALDGQLRSLHRAMSDAHISPSEIDYVNAHATSTPIGDSVEAQAIAKVLGSKIPVSSTKSMTGHECWMAGASEIVYSILMMQNDFIAPTINFEHPDEDSQKINVIAEYTPQKIDCFLSNSFGFGGTNSSIIVRKCPI